jgi:membrane protein implicated in regulation of membrane protease activity
VKKYSILLLIVLVLAVGCQDKAAKIEEQPGQQKAAVDETAAGGFTGTALETIKADRYTYVQVDIGTEKIWTATPNFRGKVGDTVVVPKGQGGRYRGRSQGTGHAELSQQDS